MRAAPADPDFLNRLAAAGAGLTFAVINGEVILHLTLCAIGFSIPVDARAFTLDSRLKHVADSPVQPDNFLTAQGICVPQGMNHRKVQRFIGIDIPDPSNTLL